MKKYKLVILLFWLAFYISPGNAQDLKQMVNFQSPNATSLGLYGEIPVSLYTGVPTIQIPLYEVKSGMLKLPIGLSYNTAAVKPDVHPGWVGMGWSLNAGGMITRKIKGTPDEYMFETDVYVLDSYPGWEPTQYYPYGYWYHSGKLDVSNWNDVNYVSTLAKADYEGINEYGIGSWGDTEPDEFIFNFCGYSGKFYFDTEGNIVVVSHPDIIVEVEDSVIGYECQPYLVENFINNAFASIDAYVYQTEVKIKGFRIITPDGIKYEFGLWNKAHDPYTMPIEISVDFFKEFYSNADWNTWYLVGIESPNGENRIDLKYKSGDPVVSFGYTVAMNQRQGETTPEGIFKIFGPVGAYSYSIANRYNGNIINPCYLETIKTDTEEISFSTTVTNEKKYDYEDILGDLYFQANNSYRLDVKSVFYNWTDATWHYSPRISIHPYTPLPVYLESQSYALIDGCGFLTRDDLPVINGTDFDECEVIDFNRLRWRQLDEIQIKNKNQDIIKNVNFTYTSDPNERLRLLSVFTSDKYDNTLPSYEFEYEDYEANDYPESDSKLPGYNSFSTDHWGYYMGPQSYSDLFADWSIYKSKRDRNEQNIKYAYAGILTRMHYPTGGYSKFVYEPHEFVKKVTRDEYGEFGITSVNSTYAGGLRIKEVQNYNSNGDFEYSKQYEYEMGILNGDLKYYWPGYQGELCNGVYTSDRFVSQSILPVSSNSTGSHIGYSKVTEKHTNNGKTVYYFQNFKDHTDVGGQEHLDINSDACIDTDKVPYSPFTNTDIERGQLKEKRIYDNDDLLVQKEENIYSQNDYLTDNYMPAVATTQIPVFEGLAIEGSAYKIYTYPYNLIKKEVTVYNNLANSEYSNIYEYEYNPENFIKSEKKQQSTGDELLTQYKYVNDYQNLSTELHPVSIPSDDDCKGLYYLKYKNIINQPIEILNYKNSNVIGGNITTYNYNLLNESVFPNKSYSLNISAPLSGFTDSEINDYGQTRKLDFNDQYNVEALYDQYDDKGNILQLHKNNDIYTSYQWGYGDKYPVMKADNATYNDIAYAMFDDNSVGNLIPLSTNSCYEIKDEHKAYAIYEDNTPEESCGLSKNNLDPTKTYTISFWAWAEPGCNINIAGNTATPDGNWSFYTFEFTGKSSVDFSNSCLEMAFVDDVKIYPSDALVNTYTYKSGVGMTSETNERGITTYYEYDSFGRLICLKDQNKDILKIYSYNYGKPGGTWINYSTMSAVISGDNSLLCNSTGTYSVTVADGEPPYQYEWRLGGEVILSENSNNNVSYTSINIDTPQNIELSCKVTDARNNFISAVKNLKIKNRVNADLDIFVRTYQNGDPGQSVDLEVSLVGECGNLNVVSTEWNFDARFEASTSYVRKTLTTYSCEYISDGTGAPGENNHTLFLTVRDDLGNSYEINKAFTVEDTPLPPDPPTLSDVELTINDCVVYAQLYTTYTSAYCEANPVGGVGISDCTYEWYVNGVKQSSTNSVYILSLPAQTGNISVKVVATYNGIVKEKESSFHYQIISGTEPNCGEIPDGDPNDPPDGNEG